MESGNRRRCTAFAGVRRIAGGALPEVAAAAKGAFDRGGCAAVLVFDDDTGEQIDIDLGADVDELVRRLAGAGGTVPVADAPCGGPPRGPGRPRLGVVAREVTLLPRHWEWLNGQPGGASVALRKLVEQARRTNGDADRRRLAKEAAYRFMTAVAGNLAGFEEAIRALFAGDAARFEALVGAWPGDVRDHAGKLAAAAFGEPGVERTA
jgi:hypothetical protein